MNLSEVDFLLKLESQFGQRKEDDGSIRFIPHVLTKSYVVNISMRKRREKSLSDVLTSDEIEQFEHSKKKLSSAVKEFNIFEFFEKVFREVEWSTVFGFLLNSSETHKQGIKPALWWLQYMIESNSEFHRIASDWPVMKVASARTTTEWSTDKRRRLDLLVEYIDDHGNILFIVGLENKVNSGEQQDQIKDYQRALSKVFKGLPKLIVYCTPDGRKSTTSIDSKDCPNINISYQSFHYVCEKVYPELSGDLHLIFRSLANYLERLIWRGNVERYSDKVAKQVTNHAQKVDYAKSIVLFNKFSDIVFGDEFDVPFIEYFSFRSWGSWSMQFFIDDQRYSVDGAEFSLCYLYHFLNEDPSIGDKYVIRLMVYWEKVYKKSPDEKLKIIDSILNDLGISNNRYSPKHFSRWINIWTSQPYSLVDMGDTDLEGLKNNLFEAMQRTYPEYEQKIHSFLKKHRHKKIQRTD